MCGCVCVRVDDVSRVPVWIWMSVRRGDGGSVCVRERESPGCVAKSHYDEFLCSSSPVPVTSGTRANERRTCGCGMAGGTGCLSWVLRARASQTTWES